MPPGATVCLSQPHFMHQQNFVCLYFHSDGAGKQSCAAVDGAAMGDRCHKRWYLPLETTLKTLSTRGKAGWVDAAHPATRLAPLLHPRSCTAGNTSTMFMFASARQRGRRRLCKVCSSQRVCAGVVSTRNNTLPWDLLNGRHLSLSVEVLGKAELRLRRVAPEGISQHGDSAARKWEKAARQNI